MTLKPDFFRYLDHFGQTMPMRELHAQPHAANAIGLRHDIDHSLDLALEVAHHEHERGIHATYFLLHTHPYWGDDQFLLKCQQLQAYGHEIGLHVNLLSRWFAGQDADFNAELKSILDQLRGGGINVVGVSAHGDKSCYQNQFINYWIFRELRGDDPATSQQRRSPEGVVVDDPERQVRYPNDHRLRREGGDEFPLWSISLDEHGLQYDAMHVPYDCYWTDTGGTWSRSPDPIQADLSRGRHQVLMHPFWWRGPGKFIFVLSTARAGSTWLANFVDRATTSRGLHEWTFNHRREGTGFVADKRTNGDYLGLIDTPNQSEKLIRVTHAFFKIQKRDVLEANVYLEPFLEQLQAEFPEASLVHLHRNGRDVVRSILNRGWYDTPFDRRHRAVPIPEWAGLSQFQRACWYFRYTNERLMEAIENRLSFERMVRDLPYLTEKLRELEVIVHPILAQAAFGKRLNAGSIEEVPPFNQWPVEMQAEFESICGEVQRKLEYETHGRQSDDRRIETSPISVARELLRFDFARTDLRRFSARGLDVKQGRHGLVLTRTASAETAAYLLLERGTWNRLEPGVGLAGSPDSTWTAAIRTIVPVGPLVRLFAIFFDDNGAQMSKRQLGAIRAENELCEHALVIPETARRVTFAVHLTGGEPGIQLLLRSFSVVEYQVHERYRTSMAFARS